MKEPLTIYCACGDALCGMTLTVLPLSSQHVKLTMTPRHDMADKEPAVEWISLAALQRRLNAEACSLFNIFKVLHYLDEDLDLDMQLSDEDRQQLLALAKGTHGENHQEGQAQSSRLVNAGSPTPEPVPSAAGSVEVL